MEEEESLLADSHAVVMEHCVGLASVLPTVQGCGLLHKVAIWHYGRMAFGLWPCGLIMHAHANRMHLASNMYIQAC